MLRLALPLVALFLCSPVQTAQDARVRAAELYAQGSFELALQAYKSIPKERLSTDDRRLVEFRILECDARSAAATENPDPSRLETALKALEELQRKAERPEQRDQLWAEGEEALGDVRYLARNRRDWGGAWSHYSNALEWWSGSSALDLARTRYLAILFKLGWPEQDSWYGGWWQGQIPLNLVENAIRIANNDDDRARAQFLFAVVARQRGADYGELQRALKFLNSAVEQGKRNPWHDDALYLLAQWLEERGIPEVDEDGQWKVEPDYVKALALYQSLVQQYGKGESRYVDDARRRIENIQQGVLGLSVPCAFLPDSEVGFHLQWRNLSKVELALYPIDLATAVRFRERNQSAGGWISEVETRGLKASWSLDYDTRDPGLHRPGESDIRIEPRPGKGAYLLEATRGKLVSRELVLIGTSTLIVKAAHDKLLLWATDALTSEPIAGARVRVWLRAYRGNDWQWSRQDAESGADGTAVIPLPADQRGLEYFAAAVQGERQAFLVGGGSNWHEPGQQWRLYAFTDRPAYRPGQTISWKVVARTKAEGRYQTPANRRIGYRITDARGQAVKQGELALNAFGSVWGELETTEALPLGEYQVGFWEGAPDKTSMLGSATLFRLEEYKLPEFEVSVSVPEENGKRKIFRHGDRIEANVEARYYFGGVVSQASVEVLVHQRPYWMRWEKTRDYPWYFERDDANWGRGGDQIISRQTVKTDATGKALVSFDAPANAGQDCEYEIEARVTDASRREVAGAGRVRVTRAAYFVEARVEHNLFRPHARAEFVFEARDANANPVAAEGKLTLVQSRWREVWLAPSGVRFDGGRENLPADTFGWRLQQRGYVEEEVASATVKTDEKGIARWSVELPREGYYSARWTSRDDRKQRIESACTLWCSDESSRELGYRSAGLEILLDKESARAGEKLPVLLALSASNRYVLLAVESEVLHSWQVVKVDGTVKLLQLPLSEAHVPNFYLSAWSTLDGNLLSASQEVVVPPVEQFLDVSLEPDRPSLQPGEKGKFHVRVRDRQGRGVAAEIGLSVVDESVLAIQSEYAADPRPYFFGEKRGQWIQTGAQQSWKGFARMRWDESSRLIDVREALRMRNDRDEEDGNYRGPGDSLAGYGKERFANEGLRAAGAKDDRKVKKNQAAPAAKSEMADRSSMAEEKQLGMLQAAVAGGGPGGDPNAVVVRSDFRETALWKPDLVSDANGEAEIELAYPDSLTRWKALARVAAADARFGVGTARVRTQKPLQARLQAPRFFVVGDELVLSGLIDNQAEGPLSVEVKLEAAGLELVDAGARVVRIAAGAQTRVDWRVRVVQPGRAELTLSARSGTLGDAMKKSYPVEAHGIEALVAGSWKLGEGELASTLDVPAARRKETTRFLVQVTPSLAVTMLDALPYLVEYPYGCTEQTMSRFLPAAIVARTLTQRGLSAEDALARVFGGIEEGVDAKVHKRDRKALRELDAITRASLERLYDFQHSDGGWGWWKTGESDPYLSAYVVWGLALARDAGVESRKEVLTRGAEYLRLELVEAEEQGDLAAWMLHALAASSRDSTDDVRVARAFDKLWKKKDGLNAFARALFALAAQGLGRTQEARQLVDSLANGAIVDEAPESSAIVPGGGQRHPLTTRTAHWGQDRVWTRWSDGGVETTSFVLRALVAVDPKNALVDPALTWLLKNRRAAQWSNTRDTTIAILALNDYLNATDELERDVEYELLVNGKSVAKRKLTAADMLQAPSQFRLPPEAVRDGPNSIVVRILSGRGPLYVSARAEFFSLEEPIPARGSELFVTRQYFRLVARPTLLKGYVYERVPVRDGGHVQSGERIEVLLTTEAKNDLEYLIFEDLKPAGFEAVEVQSGDDFTVRELKSKEVAYRFGTGEPLEAPRLDDGERFTGRARGLHGEWRDRKVALFVDKLPQGVWEMRYELRAEVPGSFHALPVLAHAMYVPEIKGNGDEVRVTVDEAREK